MLLDFSVQNFKSFRDRQTLSLIAAPDKALESSHTLPTGLGAIPAVVRSAVLYGANASGKSNLLGALQYMQQLVLQSFAIGPHASTGFVPFRLDRASALLPGEFEISLLIDGVRWQYGFRLDAQRVHEEWLVVYKTQKGQAWFDRKYDPSTGRDEYEFSDKFTGAKKLWQESTRSNALFLTTAVQFNSELLLPLSRWFATMPVFFQPLPMGAEYTVSRLAEPAFHDQLVAFLQASDIPVIRIDVETSRAIGPQMRLDMATGKMETTQEEIVLKRPRFLHVTPSGEAMFELHEESLGTQRLFALAGPILDILEKGRLLVIDELESSLHPFLVSRLVELFHNPSLNARGAQLLFTTHNTKLLDLKRLRRDQIWFVNKNAAQASSLEPLSNYSVRAELSLEKAYLQGRFDAVPVLSRELVRGA